MKFLICEATDEQLDNNGEFDLFKGEDGCFYNYEIDFDVDTVRITDTINRMVPIGVEELDIVLMILNRINNYVKSTETLNEFLYQKLIQGASTH